MWTKIKNWFGFPQEFGPKDQFWFDELEASSNLLSLSTTIELSELARLRRIDSSAGAFILADVCRIHRCGKSRVSRKALEEALEVKKEDIQMDAK